MTKQHQTQKTTTLIEVRDFLAENQVEVLPWAASDSVVEALYELLHSRREDDAFWAELRDLVARLDDRRFNPTPLLGAETLSDGRIERIVTDLRDSLSEDSYVQYPAWRAWLTRTTGVGALAAFLLLGSAAGCREVAPESTPVEQEVCIDAEDEGFTGDVGLDYCDLLDIMDEADIYSESRDVLLECLPELDAEYRANLLDDFENMTDEEMAQRLEVLAWSSRCEDFNEWEDAH